MLNHVKSSAEYALEVSLQKAKEEVKRLERLLEEERFREYRRP